MSWLWHLMGPLFVFLSFAFPILIVTQNHKRLAATDFVMSGLFLAFGAWCSVYMARYSVTLLVDGFVLQGIVGRKYVRWRDVTNVKIGEKAIRFTLTNGRTVDLSIYFSGLREVLVRAEAELPPVAWHAAA